MKFFNDAMLRNMTAQELMRYANDDPRIAIQLAEHTTGRTCGPWKDLVILTVDQFDNLAQCADCIEMSDHEADSSLQGLEAAAELVKEQMPALTDLIKNVIYLAQEISDALTGACSSARIASSVINEIRRDD